MKSILDEKTFSIQIIDNSTGEAVFKKDGHGILCGVVRVNSDDGDNFNAEEDGMYVGVDSVIPVALVTTSRAAMTCLFNNKEVSKRLNKRNFARATATVRAMLRGEMLDIKDGESIDSLTTVSMEEILEKLKRVGESLKGKKGDDEKED